MVRMVQILLWTSVLLIRLSAGSFSVTISGTKAALCQMSAAIDTTGSSCVSGDSFSISSDLGTSQVIAPVSFVSGTTSYTLNFYCDQPGTITFTVRCGSNDSGISVAETVGIASLTISAITSGSSTTSYTPTVDLKYSGATCSNVVSKTIRLSLSPGGKLSTTPSATLTSGTATFSSFSVLSPGSFQLVATSTFAYISPGISSSFTITASIASIVVSPSVFQVASGTSFAVDVQLIGEDGNLYKTAVSVTFTESSGTAISGATSPVSITTGVYTFSSVSFSTNGVKVLKATGSGVEGYSSVIVTASTNTVSLTYTGTAIINHYITVTSYLYDITSNLVTTSNSAALSGSIVGGSSTSSSTGMVTFSVYFTATGSQTITSTHGGVTGTLNIAVSTNTAVITPSQVWGLQPSTFTYTVYLLYQPAVNEVINLAVSDSSQLSLSASSLTFSADYTPQTVTITVKQTTFVGSKTVTVTHSNSNMVYSSPSSAISSAGDFTFTVYAPSSTYIIMSSAPIMKEGGSSTTTFYLSAAPSSDVTISLTSDSSISFTPNSMLFTTANYNTPQSVTVTSAVSVINEPGSNDHTISFTTSSTDGAWANPGSVPSPLEAYVVKLNSPAVLISETVVFQESMGGSYSIVLSSVPTSTVTVSLSISGSTMTISPASLSFTSTNYNIPQSISLSTTVGSTPRALKYKETITHTVSSSDPNYNGITPIPSNIITVTAVNPCKAGLYSWPPGSGTCILCPLGYECPKLYEDKVACTTGYFSPPGLWNCIPCPPNHSCPGSTMPVPCPDGTTSLEGVGVCSDCIGVSCDKAGGTSSSTPSGFYMMNKGHSMYICPPGYYCTGGSDQPVACSPGYYAPIGSSSCSQCPQGYYCPDKATPIPIPCDAYSYSVAGETSCHYCPIGFKCDKTSKTACAGTEYSLEGWMECLTADQMARGGGSNFCGLGSYYSGSACTTCPAGYQCDGTFQKPCPPGWYSSAGASGCTQCALGSYSNTVASTTCTTVSSAGVISNLYNMGSIQCGRGLTSDLSNTACRSCDAGKNCDNPTSPVACTAGNVCYPIGVHLNSAINSVPCPSGTYNPSTGSVDYSSCLDCTFGNYCPKGASTQTTCPMGHICPPNSWLPDLYACPAGYYQPSTGKYLFNSLGCSLGYFCQGSTATDCIDCPVGYYCYSGASVKLQCTDGYYCPVNTFYPFACPPGKTSPKNSDALADCVSCTAGQFCPPGSYAWSCPPGTFNSATDGKFIWDSCTVCPAGSSCTNYAQTSGITFPCSKGHYCPTQTEHPEQFPCNAGSFTDSTSLTSVTGCTACPAGFYCTLGSTSTDQIPCPRGHFCPISSGYSHYNPCPSGTFSWLIQKTQTSDCGACTAGFYCMRGSPYVSGYCSPGYYCPASSTFPDVQTHACAGGTFMPYYNATASTDCIACPAGSYCPSGSPNPIICSAGYYSAGSASSCTPCGAGYYCPQGSTAQTLCAAGYYSLSSSSLCVACPGGYYCASGIKSPCTAGNYCPSGSSSQTTCPAGYYCSGVSAVPTPCPAGTYRATTGGAAPGDCDNVNAGYYSINASTSATGTGQCEPGYYCPTGSSGPFQNPCPAGSYQQTSGGSSPTCTPCPQGYYCKLGTAFPVICPVGYYCVASTSTPVFCPSGTIGLTTGLVSSSACSSCTSGSFCTQPGLLVPDGACAPGYVCTAGSSSSSGGSASCPSGGYCQPGFITQRTCPPGTYNPNTGAKDVTGCGQCDSGYYCYGNEVSKGQRSCTQGYYCPIGSYWSKMKITYPGYFSIAAQSSPTICAVGTFNRLYYQSACSSCTAGFYCPSKGMLEPTICPTGYFCVAGVSIYDSCPAGKFNPRKGLTQSSDCVSCTPGYYCLTAGLSAVTGPCDPGYYCTYGASSNKPATPLNPANGVFGQCQTGFYCPQGSPVAIACPTGTYNPAALQSALSNCLPCDNGMYCTNTGLSAVQGSCDPGYYCIAGATLGQTVPRPTSTASEKFYCEEGKYCPTGSSGSTSVPQGNYQDEQRKDNFKSCPAGFFCNVGTGFYEANICPIGYYCPSGTEFNNQYPCPQGTYNPTLGLTSSTDCLECPAGFYCATAGKKSIDTTADRCAAGYFCKKGSKLDKPIADYPGDDNGGRCIKGYYCPIGSAFALGCDGGKYCGADLLGDVSGDCTAGYYCIGKATTSTPTDGTTGNICPPGHYCPTGSMSPTPCPKGTYNSLYAQTSVSACLPCTAKYYCAGVGLSAPTGLCAPGYYCTGSNYEYMPALGQCTAGNYCASGSSAKTQCASGYYQDLPMQSSCKKCPAGYYCNLSGMTTPVLCEAGYYCPLGSTDHQPCPSGTYTAILGRVRATQCVNCPPGKYCLGGGAIPDGPCDPGYFCLGGSTKSRPTVDAEGGICPQGYYCPTGSVSPIKCTPGSYCDTKGLSAVAGDCSQGYYCLEGATSATPTNRVTGNICSAGYYCPVKSAFPVPCSIGTYQPSQGKTQASDCLTCPSGYYCAATAAKSFNGTCAAGFFCPSGSTIQANPANICTVGNYCPIGSSTPTPCKAGTYQDRTGQSTCSQCPAGFYCDAGTINPVMCEVGFKCPAGTSSTTKATCDSGYYNPFQGQSDCYVCPRGYYCPSSSTGITDPTDCPAGSYCPDGTSSDKNYCPPGTYSLKTGLQTKDQCLQCIVGSYCLGGVIVEQCSPGFYCVSGCNTPTPDSYTNSGTGYPCPQGHYCLIGTIIPTPCPSGKFRVQTGGKTVDDCTYCNAGYYCIPNNPVPVVCPSGAYCPQGSSTPLLCKSGYYSTATQATSSSVCTVCPAGYICNRAGIGDYRNFPCTPGYYCPSGVQLPIKAPATYYSPGAVAGSVKDLLVCPGGYFCEEMSTGYTKCNIGTYCPQGTKVPINCDQGYFCDYTSAGQANCPIGWYCHVYTYPMSNYPPLLCPEGTICPLKSLGGNSYIGSIVPIFCSAGQYAFMARNVNTLNTTCLTCPPGMYSYVGWTKCLYCDPGYICLGGSSVPNPTDREIYNGYQCGQGYYCPSGIDAPIPCPAGTYTLNLTLGSLSDCTPCPVNTFNDIPASTNCTDCSSSSTSVLGATSCLCIGKQRVYLKKSKSCVCQVGYQYIDFNGVDQSNTDGTSDCVEIVYSRCQTGDVRDELGNCRSSTDCSAFCNGGTGTRTISTGTCQCKDIKDLSSICGEDCRKNSTSYRLGADGSVIQTNADGSSSSMPINQVPGFAGSVNCAGGNCKLVSVSTNNGVFKGNYGQSPALTNTTLSRRLAVSDTFSVDNPVVCLDLGSTMMFSVQTPRHFPIYLKDSLLNTNKLFDYSQFTELANNITKGGASVSVFGFTFNQAGIYIFADYTNNDQQIIIGVMDANKQCPFGSGYIQPRMTSSLHLLGVKLDENIVLTVNWYTVYGVMAFLIFSIFVFTAFFYYYSKLVWSVPPLTHIEYREENQVLDIKDELGPVNTKKIIIEGKEVDSSGSEAEEIGDMVNEKVPESADYEVSEVKEDKNLIDAALMQSIKDKIRDNNGMFRKFMEDNDSETADRLHRLEQEADDLKNLMESLLNPIRSSYPKPMTAGSNEYHLDGNLGANSEVDYQEALNEIAVNEDLLEQDKQKLMSELNSELSKLDNNLKLEKSKHDSDLSRKLAERAQKRRELEKKKQDLEADEKVAVKKHQNEKKQINIEIENSEVQIEHEIHEDKFEMARELHGQKAIELQNKLREGVAINPEKQQELFRQYELEIQGLEKNLSINQIRQQQELAKKIEEKKRQRKAQLAERKARLAAELENKQKLELHDLAQRRAEIEALEVVANIMPVFKEKLEDTALHELEEKQKKEVAEAEKNLKEQEEQELMKTMRNTSINEAKLSQQKNMLESQKRDLLKSLESATLEEKDELLNDLRRTENKLKEISEEQTAEQKKNLDARLENRRKKRDEKLKELKEKQDKEREKIEKEMKEKEKTDKASSLEAAIKEALGKLQEDQKAKAIQQMLEEKHENEQIELNKKLKKKIRDRQKRTIQEVMNMKIKDLELLRNEFKEKNKAAGRDAESSAKIQKEENEALAKLDYHYMKKLEKMQEDDWKDQQKKNQEELLSLIDAQLAEMRKYLHKKDPNTQELEERVRKEREEIEKEGRDKLEYLDKQKRDLEEQRVQKQREIEEIMKKEKEREERERMKKEVQDKKRAIMERQKKEREDLLRKGLMTKEQMEKLIADHQRELNALEMAIARERERQIGIMSQKIAEKKAKKKEYESSMQRMKEEQERLQKELEELPGITNKQATTLLLKWRRYPKKNIKDIEKSVKNNDPAHKIMPIVNKGTGKAGKKVENKRLEELVWRVEKIENTVDHVNEEHINNIFSSLKVIEESIKGMKK